MCVIAYCPPGQELTHDQAYAMFDTNPDGAGFGWLDRHNQWRIQTFMEFQPFWNAYKGTTQGYTDRDFLIHFRIGTHGSKTIDNVHPFRVDHNTIMAHNGIIDCVQDYKDGRSDTRVFVEETLPELPELWLDTPNLRWMVESAIGRSKLAFLTNNPRLSKRVYLLNKQAGKELENGIWVSNDYWEWALPGAVRTLPAQVIHRYPNAWYPMSDGKEGWRPASEADLLTAEEEAEVQMELDAERARRKLIMAPSLSLDVFKLKGMIEDQRATLGHTQEVSLVDGEWTCWGCLTELDTLGDCCCFDAVCLGCHDYAEYCKCGYDEKDIVLIEEILDDLDEYAPHLDALGALDQEIRSHAGCLRTPRL